MKIDRRRRLFYFIAAVSILTSVLLAVLLREEIRARLVVPVSYVVWYINLILETVPQPILWIALIFFGFVVAGRVILKNLPQSELPKEPVFSGQSASRFQYWMWYITTYRISPFANENLARNLSRLLLEIIAHQEHLTLEETESSLQKGNLNLPDDIRQFLLTRRLTKSTPQVRPVRRWIDRLLQRAMPNRLEPQESSEARQKLERITQFIEDRLEIQHGTNP